MRHSLKTAVTLLLAFILTYNFTNAETSILNISSLGSYAQPTIGSVPSKNFENATGSQTVGTSRSFVQVYDGLNRLGTVALDGRFALTYVTAGSSTLIDPPLNIRQKIDTELLNLTDLLTKGYLTDNETDLILSLQEASIISQKPETTPLFESLTQNVKTLYASKNAYTNMRFLAVHTSYSEIFELANASQVEHVWLDRKFRACLDQSVRIVKNPEEWANFENSMHRSVNGSGITIAVIDTGIDSEHPDFSFPNGTSKITGSVSFTDESTADGLGHGTHCASIAAGTGQASGGQYMGVAPGASLLNVKVLDNQGNGQESWMISGIQWAVDNGANVLSMSFGTNEKSDGSDPLSTTVDWATNQGALCVVAAGNQGSAMYSINTPGVSKLAITVGASDNSDIIADFSSRGPTSDYRIKPDLVAPGVDIIAARAHDTNMGNPVSQYYTKASGTSMATPHVAGAAALLMDAYPSWGPAIMKTALTNYADNIGATVFDQGTGRLNACNAANASFVSNSSISIGRVGLDTTYKHTFNVRSLASNTLNIALAAQTWHIDDNTPYDVVALNASTTILPPSQTASIQLTLTTSSMLPSGYFEGRITASSDNSIIRIPFFFCIVSQLNVKVKDESNNNLMAAFVLLDAATNVLKAFQTEREQAQFTIFPGDYIIQAMNDLGSRSSGNTDPGIAFLIHRRFTITADETLNLDLSLASAYKLHVRSTDTEGTPLHLVQKQIFTPYYTMIQLSDMGTLADQYIYLTNVTECTGTPCFFGYAGFPHDYTYWNQTGILTSAVSPYFLAWDLSTFGRLPIPDSLNFNASDLAVFNVETSLPTSSSVTTLWFNQVSGLWKAGLWYGYQTHPGITWKIHVLPCQFKNSPSQNYSQLEWSCFYAFSKQPDASPDNYIIDRHFQPIVKGENLSYSMGKTPVLPQEVIDSPPYYGSGLYIPYYPLHVQKNLFLLKADMQKTKRVEVYKNSVLISNETKKWAEEPIPVTQILNSNGYGLYNFVVKTETTLNFSSQNTATYTINYTGTNTDLIPPSITEVDCEPCFIQDTYQVDLHFTDNDKVSDASLSYSVNDDPYLPATLADMGNGAYHASLALSPSAQKLSIIIESTDRNGNKIRFNTTPVALRGYETQVDAKLDQNTMTGKLAIIGKTLIQPLYLRVKTSQETYFTLTDAQGNFQFTVPQSLVFPIQIEMVSTLTYHGSSLTINNQQVHNLAITQLATSKTVVGYQLHANITVANLGDTPETSTVTLYANSTPVASGNFGVSNGRFVLVQILWDVAGFTKGNCTMSAYVQPVPNEANITDNTYVDGSVKVTIVGDIDGNGRVDMMDIGRTARAFSTHPGDSLWNPIADIIEDNIIDMKDVGLVARHFCEHI